MKELIIISGKGGTGKTSLIAAFASLAQNKVLCDADVDAADLHLLMAPNIVRRADFISGHTAVIDTDSLADGPTRQNPPDLPDLARECGERVAPPGRPRSASLPTPNQTTKTIP